MPGKSRRAAQLHREVVTADTARSVQLHAGDREDRFPEVRLGAVAQGAAYCPNGLCRQGHESGI